VALVGGAKGFIIANLLTAAVFTVAAAVVIRSDVTFAFRPAVIREALLIGGPAVPNNLLSYGFRLLDRVILQRVATLEQVGVYYLALRLADVMRLCADTLINAWRPIFFKEGALDGFAQNEAPRLIRLVTAIVVTIFVVLSLFARELVSLLATPQYSAASGLVPILVGAMAIKALQSFPSLVFWLRKQTKWVPTLTASTLVVSVAANWLLAPRWGVTGIAMALVISHSFLAGFMFVMARRFYTLVYPWREMIIAAALGLITVVIALVEPAAASAASIAGKFILLAFYGVALLATGCLPWNDVRALLVRRPLVSLESKAG
jgi:O-antigen/teichoic acid export membrane protein